MEKKANQNCHLRKGGAPVFSIMYEPIRLVDLQKVNPASFAFCGVDCIVLAQNNKILLQQRGKNWQRFPGYLAAFGGQIEIGETPIQALIRELYEELGAQVDPSAVIGFGAITEIVTKHSELIYAYFWHDKYGTITGCYEGEAKYYDNYVAALKHPKIMDDVRWLLNECQKHNLLK